MAWAAESIVGQGILEGAGIVDGDGFAAAGATFKFCAGFGGTADGSCVGVLTETAAGRTSFCRLPPVPGFSGMNSLLMIRF